MKKVFLVLLLTLVFDFILFSQSGKVPFDFPTQQQISCLKGDFVLYPPENWIKDAFTKGANKTTFIYYGAYMEQPASYESKIKSLTGSIASIPNAMIIPIRRGEKVKTGDILLTHWQSGSGMQRAIVVGGSPTEPIVRYLDITYDNPSGWGKKDDKCKANTFHKLNKEYEPGTAIAVKNGNEWVHWKIINTSGSKILMIGFAGKMDVCDKANTKAAPVKFLPKVGDKVFVPNIVDKFSKGIVKSIDAKIGRIFVEIDWAGKKQVMATPIGSVIANLP
jgi:hypothetical protein